MPYVSCTFKSRKLVKLGYKDLVASIKVTVEVKEVLEHVYVNI